MSPCGVQASVCELFAACKCYGCALQVCPGPCALQACPGSEGCVGCNTQHNVDNLTLRLVVACIAQGYVGPILPKPEPNETLMIPGT